MDSAVETPVEDIADATEAVETATENPVDEAQSVPGEPTEATEEGSQAEAKPAETNPPEAVKAGKLSLYAEVSHRLIGLRDDLLDVDEVISELKAKQKRAKDRRDAIVDSISARLKDLQDIENGCYQRNLFTGHDDDDQPTKKELPPDPGLTTPIANLGMSDKETEILVAHDITTVAELESKMKADNWWHKKIKGFGTAKVDKLVDQLEIWRRKNPVPTLEDLDDDDDDIEAEESTEEDSEEAAEADAEAGDVFDQIDDNDTEETEADDSEEV